MKKVIGIALILFGVMIAVLSLRSNIIGEFRLSHHMNSIAMQNIDKYDEIIVTMGGLDIEVYTTNNKMIDLSFTNKDDMYEVVTNESNNILNIEIFRKQKVKFFHFRTDEVQFYLPESYHEKFVIHQKGGNVEFQQSLNLKELHVDTKAGNIEDLSGEIDKLILESKAGNIEGYQLTTLETLINQKAGNVELKQFSGSLVGESKAGNVEVEYVDENKEINWSSKAGNIDLSIPSPNFILSVSTKAGKEEIDIPLSSENGKRIAGNGDYAVELSVKAGNIEMK